ncbi:50S ribosomal protein L35 [Sporolactobacillus shoreicorticis]|uniref:Large ribosomal subunit protein bL35 n=1 Tax=Sporolactobacillus shoreicorticis TaxID=1923877 RepID=A0ABW5RXG9_9BACL|nr:50S ribosomal protein L35 [Sporolactobacillus shoreicorticis]MCO7124813.1 50S ribosomal protein L35 [Sporolactobacillus shoreicorticis]
MPKMKTHKGAAKRFKKTGTGKFKREHGFTSHMFSHKSNKQKRNLDKSTIATSTLAKKLKKLIND